MRRVLAVVCLVILLAFPPSLLAAEAGEPPSRDVLDSVIELIRSGDADLLPVALEKVRGGLKGEDFTRELAEVVLPGLERSQDQAALLAALADRVPTAVVKLGRHGSIACRTSADRTSSPGDRPDHVAPDAPGESAAARAFDAEVVDTTGAGDAFAAGFLPAWAAGHALHHCLDAAARSAARAVARVGAGPIAAPPGE